MEKVSFNGWENCIKLSNGQVELIATTDIGPRIMRYAFVGGQNLFKEAPADQGQTGGGEWRGYGGHRLWHAPEVEPRTYWPDNVPVEHSWDGKTLTLTQPMEESTRVSKQIEITLADQGSKVHLVHKITNHNLWDIEFSPWTLTVMNQGGRLIIPQEEWGGHPQYLLPARPLVMWRYTNMADPRWTWGEKYIQLEQQPGNATKQKVGVGNTKGWIAYTLNGEVFIKKFPYIEGATYPDLGCNFETFTNEDMLEAEALGPLTKLAPEATVELIEDWDLQKTDIGNNDADIDAKLLPLVD